jgi:signal transduction histidine kinase
LGTAGFDFEDFIPYFSVSLEDQVAFLTLINPLTSTLFMSYVADVLHTPRKLTSNLRKYVLALILLAPMYFLFDSTLWAKIYMLNNFLLSAVMVYALIKYFDRKSKVEWAIVIIFVLMNLMGPRVYASFLGWVQINTSIFIVQSLRIVVVPIVLILMLALIESKNRARLVDLEIKRQVAEENQSIENERRRTYERFITMIVHEIKTPLSIIQIAAASLQRHLANNMPELNRITHIQESVTEINQVFNKCIQVVDVENGSVAVQPSDFGLTVLIDDLKRSLKSDRIRYALENVQKINTDYVILKTILVNLLSNAIKYAKADTAIFLTVQPHNSEEGKPQLVFKICNEVGPIGPPDRNLVFKRYYRAESAKVLGGTGLGLWLSQELASSIRAHIQLSGTDTETCFNVSVDMN